MKSQYLQIFISGSVRCGTDVTLFYHSGFILFIEDTFSEYKTEDGEIISQNLYYIILQMLENFCYSFINRSVN
jgi:hypothetical protein